MNYAFIDLDLILLCCVFVSDGASQAVMSPLLCPPGLECLLDAGQLVTHMGNLRHDYSQFSVFVLHRSPLIQTP